MTKSLTQVVNWAYRGKNGEEGWTGEAHLLDGVRITSEQMEKLLVSQNPARSLVFAAIDATNPNKQMVVGSIHAMLRKDGRAEFGLFAVDPKLQSSGIGGKLLNAAETHARDVWQVQEAVMYLLDVREKLFAWYSKKGYEKTGKKVPFPDDVDVGVPKVELQFDELLKKF
eukprot:CAMPEP_0167741866 /NCGR_PEP_ID=MMETSP0110_2-20121227/1097_1 /TAXON_ID=629695 /ORGANISM="Gymnochlora sp., Strain CCMP2014" /LENGTH=169 /DNA_ID=CAMNT_0007625971 /DNA_START=248 /DNA_END=757 /DNA_ORIENTATION=+